MSEWFYKKASGGILNKEQQGPFSTGEIAGLYKENKVDSHTYFMGERTSHHWKKAVDIPFLSTEFARIDVEKLKHSEVERVRTEEERKARFELFEKQRLERIESNKEARRAREQQTLKELVSVRETIHVRTADLRSISKNVFSTVETMQHIVGFCAIVGGVIALQQTTLGWVFVGAGVFQILFARAFGCLGDLMINSNLLLEAILHEQQKE